MRRRSAPASETPPHPPKLALPPPPVVEAADVADPMGEEAALPHPALRHGLLVYSGVLTAVGSSVALGVVQHPVTVAAVAKHPVPPAIAVSALPPPPPPTTVPPPTTTTTTAPPTTTTPPTTAVHVTTTSTTTVKAVSNSSSLSGIWACIRQKESGDNYQENSGNGYYGAYQFDEGTWQSLGYSGRPDQAPPAEQDAAAQKLYSERGFAPWPNSSRECGA